MLETSPVQLPPRSYRPGAVESHPVQMLTGDRPRYGMRDQVTYSKYPNQVSKIICTSMVMLIALIFGFHRS